MLKQIGFHITHQKGTLNDWYKTSTKGNPQMVKESWLLLKTSVQSVGQSEFFTCFLSALHYLASRGQLFNVMPLILVGGEISMQSWDVPQTPLDNIRAWLENKKYRKKRKKNHFQLNSPDAVAVVKMRLDNCMHFPSPIKLWPQEGRMNLAVL